MGSNILSTKKKESSLKVLDQTEKVTKEVISMLNDDNKFPKRQRAMFGARFANNALNSYECLRAANKLYPESKVLVRERYKLAIEAEKSMNALISDINLLPTITNTCDNTTKWYNDIQMQAIKCESSMKNWRRSETKRYKEDIIKLSSKNSTNDNKKIISIDTKNSEAV